MSACVLVSERRYVRGHVVRKKDRARIPCVTCRVARATRCEHVPPVSTFYYCDRCWIVEGYHGTSPRDRAHGRHALGPPKQFTADHVGDEPFTLRAFADDNAHDDECDAWVAVLESLSVGERVTFDFNTYTRVT